MTTTKPKRKKNWQGKPRQVSLTIGVYPEELAKWKAEAKAEDRSLSQWIRLRLSVPTREGVRALAAIPGAAESAPEPRNEQRE